MLKLPEEIPPDPLAIFHVSGNVSTPQFQILKNRDAFKGTRSGKWFDLDWSGRARPLGRREADICRRVWRVRTPFVFSPPPFDFSFLLYLVYVANAPLWRRIYQIKKKQHGWYAGGQGSSFPFFFFFWEESTLCFRWSPAYTGHVYVLTKLQSIVLSWLCMILLDILWSMLSTWWPLNHIKTSLVPSRLFTQVSFLPPVSLSLGRVRSSQA